MNEQSEAQILALIQFLETAPIVDEAQQEQLRKYVKKVQSTLVNDQTVQKRPLKASIKLSKRHKKQLYKLAKRLLKLVKHKHVSDELKKEALLMVKEILSYLDEADQRDKQFLSQQTKQVIGISSVLLLLGVKLYQTTQAKK